MPDWISHILLGLIIAEVFNIRKKSLVVLGSILPDIILKIYALSIIIPMKINFLFWFLYPLHTIAGITILSFLLTIAFKYDAKKTFGLIFIGAVFHILLDGTTKFMLYNIQGLFLFPFSWKYYGIGIFYPEQYWIVMVLLFGIYVILRPILRMYRRNNQAK